MEKLMMPVMTNDELLARLSKGAQMKDLTYTVYSNVQQRHVQQAAEGAGCTYSLLTDPEKRRKVTIWITGTSEELANCAKRVAAAMSNGR